LEGHKSSLETATAPLSQRAPTLQTPKTARLQSGTRGAFHFDCALIFFNTAKFQHTNICLKRPFLAGVDVSTLSIPLKATETAAGISQIDFCVFDCSGTLKYLIVRFSPLSQHINFRRRIDFFADPASILDR
jgi:hypothetical protein